MSKAGQRVKGSKARARSSRRKTKPSPPRPFLPEGWGALHLRLTLFFNGVLQPTAELWKELFGDNLQQVNLLPTYTAIGISEDAVVALSVGPGRLDIVANPVGTVVDGDEPVPVIDVLSSPALVAKRMLLAAETLSARVPGGLTRAAAGGHFRLVVGSRAEGYSLLPKYVPFISPFDAAAYQEFNLQINSIRSLPKQAVGQPLTLNRITRWSVMVANTLALQFNVAKGEQSPKAPKSAHALRVELDINTQASAGQVVNGVAPKRLLEALIGEFAVLLASGLRPT